MPNSTMKINYDGVKYATFTLCEICCIYIRVNKGIEN
jgi:hypothetical protein